MPTVNHSESTIEYMQGTIDRSHGSMPVVGKTAHYYAAFKRKDSEKDYHGIIDNFVDKIAGLVK